MDRVNELPEEVEWSEYRREAFCVWMRNRLHPTVMDECQWADGMLGRVVQQTVNWWVEREFPVFEKMLLEAFPGSSVFRDDETPEGYRLAIRFPFMDGTYGVDMTYRDSLEVLKERVQKYIQESIKRLQADGYDLWPPEKSSH